jgi:GDP-L-fucose synthase
MGFWKNKKVLITGGAGFIGSHLAEYVSDKGAKVKVTARDPKKINLAENIAPEINLEVVEANLLDEKSAINAVNNSDVVFHLAAIVGGVQYNLEHPATMLMANTRITSNVLEALRKCEVERAVVVSSACVYPDNYELPLTEDLGFTGEPDKAKFGYAWSKRFDELLTKAYCDEFGLKIGIARPFNVYGPRDVFDPKKSHVIPSLIHRIKENKTVKIFGNGQQERSFIYVKDLVEGIAKIAELYPKPDPINLGSKESVKIIDLAKKIAQIMGKNPVFEFDDKSNAGSLKRLCDTAKAERLINFKAKTSIDKGLKETIKWALRHG